MENTQLNDEQQQIFDNISNIDSGLYFIEGTLGSRKTFSLSTSQTTSSKR